MKPILLAALTLLPLAAQNQELGLLLGTLRGSGAPALDAGTAL